MEDENPDYVTVLPTPKTGKWMAVVMRYLSGAYFIAIASEPVGRTDAEYLAQDWAERRKVERR